MTDAAGTRVRTEALAIMVCLAQCRPEAERVVTEPELFARMPECMGWLGSTVHQTGIRAVLRPERFTRDPSGAPAIAVQARENVAAANADLAQRLPIGGDALGERFTILDAYLLVFHRWGNRIGLDLPARASRFAGLIGRVRARPAVQRIIAREGIEIDP